MSFQLLRGRYFPQLISRQFIRQSRTPNRSLLNISKRCYSVEIDKGRSRNVIQTFASLGLFLVAGAGLMYYFKQEKEKIKNKSATPMNQTYGAPKIGGPFKLTDHNGEIKSDEDFRGKYMMVYFGFTHCPDICPAEMKKMAEVINLLEKDKDVGENVVLPIFITCDPKRDSVEAVKKYINEYHPKFIGLTGSYEEIAQAAKAYRVYFSKPTITAEDENYIVDHSIFMYFMDPEGKFVDCFGMNTTSTEVAEACAKYISKFKEDGGHLL